MFKPSLDQDKNLKGYSDVSSPAATEVGRDCSFYEYHWDGPRRFHFPVWQPRQTTLFVVFDGESRRLFSSARILLYYSKSSLKDARSNVWDIQPLGSVIHSFRNQVRHAPPNASTLPSLTVAFEVTVGQTSASKPPFGILAFRSPDSIQELRCDSITVLLERELALTSETSSLSLSFAHSTLLCTSVTPGTIGQPTVPINPVTQIELITTRIVRVLPPESARPKIANGYLPTELLIKTFEDAEFRSSWHDDLLSFAQVCRAWSCAMHVLQSRLSFSDGGDDDDRYHLPLLLDTYALARALITKPVLGRALRHLTTNNLGESQSKRAWENVVFGQPPRKDPARFMAALITILRATKNLQCLHLGQLDEPGSDPRHAHALFIVLSELRHLRTFSIGPTEEEGPAMGFSPTKSRWTDNGRDSGLGFSGEGGGDKVRTLSVAQLARCMARWPALKSLKVYHLQAGTVPAALGIWRFHWTLRPAPACALTQLVLCRSYVTDRDLVHLFGGVGKGYTSTTTSSANAITKRTSTLEHVVLDRVGGVTNAGLAAFFLAISQSLVSLAVRDVALPPFRQRGNLVLVGVRGGVSDCASGGGGGIGGVSTGNGKVISRNRVSGRVISGRLGSAGVINGYGCGRHRRYSERALDVVLDKLPRLRELRIGGDVASELMLDRRSKMFLASCGGRASSSSSGEDDEDEEGEEGTRVPVVRLWIEVDVPRLRGFVADGKWPGWCTPGKVAR